VGLYEIGIQQRDSKRRLVFALVALTAIVGSCAKSAYALDHDKVDHAVYSGAIYGTVALIGNSHNHENPDLLLPWAITMGLGLFKELTDSRFDTGDLLADGVGATAGCLVMTLTW
jgi:hypothetical protein